MAIKTFRGLLADGEQLQINLRTNKGNIGYRIVKFEILSATPVTAGAQESVVQLWKAEQSAPSTSTISINFSDLDLIAAATWTGSDNPIYSNQQQVVFDSEIFNQNIFITHTNTDGAAAVNYYLELEQIKLNDNESTMATLQSIRSRYEAYTPAGPT